MGNAISGEQTLLLKEFNYFRDSFKNINESEIIHALYNHRYVKMYHNFKLYIKNI